MYRVLRISCESLEAWAEDNVRPKDSMLVDGAGSPPTAESSGSDTDGTITPRQWSNTTILKKGTSEDEGPHSTSPVPEPTIGQRSRHELLDLPTPERWVSGGDKQDSAGIAPGPSFTVSLRRCTFFPSLNPVQPSKPRTSTPSDNSESGRAPGTATPEPQIHGWHESPARPPSEPVH
jgi:hypothetical protein